MHVFFIMKCQCIHHDGGVDVRVIDAKLRQEMSGGHTDAQPCTTLDGGCGDGRTLRWHLRTEALVKELLGRMCIHDVFKVVAQPDSSGDVLNYVGVGVLRVFH